jgi:hypothetical protein
MQILCKDVHICHTNFIKIMERNSHGSTSRWKTYKKQLFSKDLEVRDGIHSTTIGPCYHNNIP